MIIRGIILKQRLLSFFEKYKLWIIGGAVGFVIAILMLTINFWRTLLLCCMTAVGCIIGMLFDARGREKIALVVDKILQKRK